MNADAFTTYVTCVLAPELSPGDIVIMDNLSSHKAPAVRAAIEAVGARLLFLPPYTLRSHSNDAAHRRNLGLLCPDFNPIEQAFSKLRAHLRKRPNGPSMAYGTPSVAFSTSTRPRNAPTTSPPAATMKTDRKPL